MRQFTKILSLKYTKVRVKFRLRLIGNKKEINVSTHIYVFRKYAFRDCTLIISS